MRLLRNVVACCGFGAEAFMPSDLFRLALPEPRFLFFFLVIVSDTIYKSCPACCALLVYIQGIATVYKAGMEEGAEWHPGQDGEEQRYDCTAGNHSK